MLQPQDTEAIRILIILAIFSVMVFLPTVLRLLLSLITAAVVVMVAAGAIFIIEAIHA